jgi:3-hydroxyisobutyrate dehydrogenase-like beta-hydroxyacid dehydrogenase
VLGAMKPEKVFVDLSTISPDAIRSLAQKFVKAGGALIDASVSGSQLTVDQGKLLIMAAGDPAAFARAEPVLRDIGPNVRLVGEIGHAKVMKLALNLQLAVQMMAMSEGVLLAEKSGISRELACEMVLGSAVSSPMLGYRGPFVLKMPEKAWFDVKMQQKDMKLALELGREAAVPLFATAAADELLTCARASGYGSKDFAVMFHTLAKMAGVDAEP